MKTRPALLLLCGCAAVSIAGQSANVPRRMRVNPAVLQLPTATVEPQVLPMPDVRLLRPDSAAVQLRRDLHHVAAFTGDGPIVIAQDPFPGADVGPDTKIVLTLGVPQLSVSTSNANPAVGEEVVFTVVTEPASGDIVYFFAWNDGSGETQSSVPRATHRFAETGTTEVVVRGRLNEIELGPVITTISPVALVPLPPPPTPDTTAETTQPPVDTTTAAQPPPLDPQPPPPALPWLTIALIAAAVLVAGALARVLRRKPPASPAAPPPAVSIRSGLGANTSHTIEHPERIRIGLTLRVRGGVR